MNMNLDELAVNIKNIYNKVVDAGTVNYLNNLTKLNKDGQLGMERLLTSIKNEKFSSEKDYVVESLTNLCELTLANFEQKFQIEKYLNRKLTIGQLVKTYKSTEDSGIMVSNMFIKDEINETPKSTDYLEVGKDNKTIKSKCMVLLEDDSIAIRR